MAVMATEAEELPADIIMDVLSRLPVKSLVRFRCIFQALFSLITHPQFGQLHLNHHRNKLQSSLIFCYPNKLTTPKFRCIGGGYREDNFSKAIELACPFIKFESFIIVGCCDGIMCLFMDKRNPISIVLWNPSIREYRTLPLPLHSTMHPYIFREVDGFGYESLTNDYKFVRLLFDNRFVSYVFTLKTNSWRRIQHVRCFKYLTLTRDGFHANGGLYWYGWANKENRRIELLLRFDLTKETFSDVSLPPNEFGNVTIWGLWESSLCMLRGYDLWLLAREGEVWTKLMTMPMIPFLLQHLTPLTSLNPLCFTNTGKVFMAVDQDGSKFVMYDPNKRTYQKLDIHGLMDHWFQNTVYADSLISPGTDNAALRTTSS